MIKNILSIKPYIDYQELVIIINKFKNKATKEYYAEGKGMMKMADARKSNLGYFGGYYDKLSNMLSIARIMEIYSQYRKLNKKHTK